MKLLPFEIVLFLLQINFLTRCFYDNTRSCIQPRNPSGIRLRPGN